MKITMKIKKQIKKQEKKKGLKVDGHQHLKNTNQKCDILSLGTGNEFPPDPFHSYLLK